MSDSNNAPPFRDPEFRLKANDRRRLDHDFNADVAEELLARYESIDRRTSALDALLELADLVARGEATITGMSTSNEHPAVDELVHRLVRQRFSRSF